MKIFMQMTAKLREKTQRSKREVAVIDRQKVCLAKMNGKSS